MKKSFITGTLAAAAILLSFTQCSENKCKTCPTYEKQKVKNETNNINNTNNVVEIKQEEEKTRYTINKDDYDPSKNALPTKDMHPPKSEHSKKEVLLDYEAVSEDAVYSGAPTHHSKVAGGINHNYTSNPGFCGTPAVDAVKPNWNTEEYDVVNENIFLTATENPLSTFSIDVDNASYTNTRRFLNNGQLPPKDAVRIEEFINYFSYDYQKPKGEHPFSINTEIGSCPWNSKHRLVHIGLQGKIYDFNEIQPMNIVFLIDVSGSMSDHNKLPLLKKSFEMLVSKMRPQDRIAITVYAGAAGLVLPSTPGTDKEKILNAINNLSAGGSTAGGAGIKLAYKVAQENLIENGVNRIILATDGDFNIGASSNAEMTRLVEENRDKGVYLTVLGFGMGNYKDSKMESIADNGNGNYFYIDNIQESNKVLVDELGSTLYTIAKDVKLQVEFNPEKVQAYRLIGYENRMLKKEDFNNDKKDAGELGAGHTVTALYEIIPVGVESEFLQTVDPLKYQKPTSNNKGSSSNELLTVKFRYKEPNATVSKLIVHPLVDKNEKSNSDNFEFSSAVAGFGMLLRDSEFKGKLDYAVVLNLAYAGKGEDKEGYRAEFIKLVKTAEMLSGVASK